MRLHQAAAIAGLAAIVSGAFITSTNVALPAGHAESGVGVHRAIALLAIAVLCAGIVAVRSTGAARIALGTALVSLIASAAIGWNYPLSPGAAVWHAALAHLFTAAIAVALVLGSSTHPANPLPAGSYSGLRPAAMAMPPAVFTQIVLGALYRHQIAGIMPHMLGAMVAALLTMIVSAIVLQYFSERAELKRAAALLICAVLVQVCLGISVFILLLLNVSDTPAFVWIATAHVTVGTLVLASSVFAALEIRRHLAAAQRGNEDSALTGFSSGRS